MCLPCISIEGTVLCHLCIVLPYFFLIVIHAMQGWTTTTSHGVTRKTSSTRLQHIYRKSVYRGLVSCARKKTVDIGILVTSKNGDRKIMQSIWITSRPTSRKRKWNQLSQSSTKVIPIEKTQANHISTMSQRFNRSCKNIAKTCCFEYFGHAWLWSPKTMVSAWWKLWFLSSHKN